MKKCVKKLFWQTVVLHNYIQHGEQDIPVNERRYCPAGFADWYDENKTVHLGRWRKMGQGHSWKDGLK